MCIYAEGEVREELKGIIEATWREESFPDRWRKGVISPIFKKGDRNQVSNYRGITLLGTSYQIYAAVLAEKLNKELEEKKNTPRNPIWIP